MTYENIGNVDAYVRVSDDASFSESLTGSPLIEEEVSYSYSYTCNSQLSTMNCPNSLSSSSSSSSGASIEFWKHDLLIPSGKKIVMNVAFNFSVGGCDSKTVYLTNKAEAHNLKGDFKFDSSSNWSQTTRARVARPECARPSVLVTKVQNKERTELGEERNYVVTYENTGEVDAYVNVYDTASFYSDVTRAKSLRVDYSYSFRCDTELSTMACPPALSWGRSHNKEERHHFWDQDVVIPAGKKIVMKAGLVIDGESCLPGGGDMYIRNGAYLHSSGMTPFANDKRERSAAVVGKVLLPACEVPSVRVMKVQDKVVTGPGEFRVYTTTYENIGKSDANIDVSDTIYFDAYMIGSRWCDQDLSTMNCPQNFYSFENKEVFDGYFSFWRGRVTIPVGKKLVLKSALAIDEKTCYEKHSIPMQLYHTDAQASLPLRRPFAGGNSVESSANVVGWVWCADVSTKTVLSDYTPVVGDRVVVATDVSNSVGVAEDVSFVLQLATDDKSGRSVNVLEPVAGVEDVSCEVSAGDTRCPSDFAYDAVSNTVAGTIPKMPAGSSVKISVNTVLTTAAKYLKTYKVYAQAPNVLGDVHLGPEGTNRSSATFSWIEKVSIAYPEAPTQVEDPCGVDNAVWVKPEDTDMVWWELVDGGRRIVAHTVEGYLFAEGATSRDYGLAPDSGELCSFVGVEIPMTGGRAADTIYATALLLAVAAGVGAGVTRRRDRRVRVYSARH